MAIQTFRFDGLYDMHKVWEKIVESFTTAGFSQIHKTDPIYPIPGMTGSPTGNGIVLFETTSAVDPLTFADPTTAPNVDDHQPYRIRFESQTDLLKVHIGTSVQLAVTTSPTGTTSAAPIIPMSKTALNTTGGMIGMTQGSATNPEEYFFERRDMTAELNQRAVPLTLIITVTDHGVALVIYESARDEQPNDMSWFVIQRPVVPASNGVVRTTGHNPVFCYFRIQRQGDKVTTAKTGPNPINGKVILRERDIMTPTISVDPTLSGPDQIPSLPADQFISVLDDGLNSINLQCIGNLHTQRYVYPNEELDMMMYTSADVLPSGVRVPVTMYGESSPREYLSLPSTGKYNTLTRMLMLVAPVTPATPAP